MKEVNRDGQGPPSRGSERREAMAIGNAAEASHRDGFWLHPLGCHGRRSQGLIACRGQDGRKAVRKKGLDHVGVKARRVDDVQES